MALTAARVDAGRENRYNKGVEDGLTRVAVSASIGCFGSRPSGSVLNSRDLNEGRLSLCQETQQR